MRKVLFSLLISLLALPAFGQVTITGMTLADVTINATAGISTCGDVANLILWLDAEAGITEDVGVTTWEDQSTSGNDCSQTTDASEPAYTATCQNSLHCVTFDGTNDYLTCTSNLGLDPESEDFTVVLVHSFGTGIAAVFGTAAGTGDLFDFKIANVPDSNMRFVTGTQAVADTTSIADDTTYLGIFTFDNTGATTYDYEFFYNGATSSSGTDASPRSEPTGNFFIGTDSDGDGDYGNASSIMELCIYTGVLSSGDIDSLEAALNSKWSIY